jgi:hypothetical protein
MKVGIVHVPKSAGTALAMVVKGHSSAYAGPRYHESTSFPAAHVRSLRGRQRDTVMTVDHARAIFEDHDVIVAHASSAFFRAAGADHVIAIVREPRARLLSLYREWQGITEANIADLGRRGTDLRAATGGGLRRFLESRPLRGQIHGAIASYLCGFPPERIGDRVAFSITRTHDPAARLGGLHGSAVDRVFWSDQLSDVIAHLGALGVMRVPADRGIEPKRIGSAPSHRQRIGPVAMRVLESAVRPDLAVIGRLAEDGVLDRRDAARLDHDFLTTLDRLGFELKEASA